MTKWASFSLLQFRCARVIRFFSRWIKPDNFKTRTLNQTKYIIFNYTVSVFYAFQHVVHQRRAQTVTQTITGTGSQKISTPCTCACLFIVLLNLGCFPQTSQQLERSCSRPVLPPKPQSSTGFLFIDWGCKSIWPYLIYNHRCLRNRADMQPLLSHGAGEQIGIKTMHGWLSAGSKKYTVLQHVTCPFGR